MAAVVEQHEKRPALPEKLKELQTKGRKNNINMTTRESILSRLTKGVSGTDQELFSKDELNKFADFYRDKWDENTSEDVIAESFVDYWWDTNRACRRCSECGKLMREGYCVDMGVAYYCSEDCLHSDFTDEEWAEECESNDQSYYTEW